MKNKVLNKHLNVEVSQKNDKVIVTVEKATVIDRTNDVWAVNGKYYGSQSCGMSVDSTNTHVVKGRNFVIRARYTGEISIGVEQFPIHKGDQIEVTKEGEVLVFRKGKKERALFVTE